MVLSVVFFSLLCDELKFKTASYSSSKASKQQQGREVARWAIAASWMWPLSPSGDRNVFYLWFSSAITLLWIYRSKQQTGHDGV